MSRIDDKEGLLQLTMTLLQGPLLAADHSALQDLTASLVVLFSHNTITLKARSASPYKYLTQTKALLNHYLSIASMQTKASRTRAMRYARSFVCFGPGAKHSSVAVCWLCLAGSYSDTAIVFARQHRTQNSKDRLRQSDRKSCHLKVEKCLRYACLNVCVPLLITLFICLVFVAINPLVAGVSACSNCNPGTYYGSSGL